MLTEFLTTKLHHAPCAEMEFNEFHERFLEWLPSNRRGRWDRNETREELRKHVELFRGNRDVLFIADLAFAPYHLNYRSATPPKQSAIDYWRERVRFIDDGAQGFWTFLDGPKWTRITVPALITTLRVILNCEETYQVRKAARANPTSLDRLLKAS